MIFIDLVKDAEGGPVFEVGAIYLNKRVAGEAYLGVEIVTETGQVLYGLVDLTTGQSRGVAVGDSQLMPSSVKELELYFQPFQGVENLNIRLEKVRVS